MYLAELASDSYVTLQAGWTVGKARGLIERLDPTHLTVHRSGPEDLYFLYTKSEAFGRLANRDVLTSLFDAFNLSECAPAPTLDSFAEADKVPNRAVILEDGRVVGFFDATVPPPEKWTSRGEGHRGPGGVEPVTRSLVTQFPDQVRMEVVSPLVSLSAEPAQRSDLPVALPVRSTIDVIVVPKRGLALEGRGEGTLTISAQQETLPLQFKLRATEVGPARLQVLAFHQGQPLGAITLAQTIIPAEQSAEAELVRRKQQMGASISANQPDLSLLIFEHQSNGQPALTFRLTAADRSLGFNLKPFGPVLLRSDPSRYFQEFFDDIEKWPVTSQVEKAKVEQRLAANGSMLFEKLLPTELQVLLWQLRQRIKVVQVQSEELWIPWELCKLVSHEDGKVVEGPFLCEAFAMTRWLPGVGFQPHLPLKNIALILPWDSGLPMANEEGEYVSSLADENRQVERIPATYLEVRAVLASGRYDGWHFTGHGVFRAPDPNRSAMLLEDKEELRPEDLSGVVSNLGLARPRVFLNACQIGRAGMSLTDIGDWSAHLLRAGAAAFIGAYWSVYDRPAHDFARAFYGHLLAGQPIGQAVQEARKAIKPLGDPTWLAYTVFADPWATVQT
jgi:hypothetical protein